MSFHELQLISPILDALNEEGYTTPTPIQAQAIPFLLDGRDLLGCAQTGTGKTAAFAIPILQLLHTHPQNAKKKNIRALIVTPTRELAIQIQESFKAYGRHLSLRSEVIFGGVGQTPQTDALRRGVDILVATPGRLIDLIGQGFITLQHIELFVLDEADRMLDMGFIHDIRRILPLLPPHRQNLFFSATMPPDIVKLAQSILHDPARVEVTPVSSTAETVQQFLYRVDRNTKNALLLHLLQNPEMRSVLVFTRTKYGADKVAKMLSRHGITAEAIHGNKAQNARQRALNQFKDGTTRVLVATDIAARGIDIDELAWVINYEIPNVPETYVHRIGRTGRAGASGTALSFADTEEAAFIRDIEKLIKRAIPMAEENPYPLTGITAEAPPKQELRPQPRQAQQVKPGGKTAKKWFGHRGGQRSGGGERK